MIRCKYNPPIGMSSITMEIIPKIAVQVFHFKKQTITHKNQINVSEGDAELHLVIFVHWIFVPLVKFTRGDQSHITAWSSQQAISSFDGFQSFLVVCLLRHRTILEARISIASAFPLPAGSPPATKTILGRSSGVKNASCAENESR
jgi:hypothetical protein